jgi:phosphinothricin acetyltransferase
MLGAMSIRPPREADFPALAAITNHYIETTAIHFAYEPFAADELRATWLGYRDRYPWLVSEEHGEVVGYAKAGAWRERRAYDWTVEIGLYVADRARGRGCGRMLYGELLAELPRRGFRSAIAGITLPNDASVALHRAFGFVSIGTVRDAGWKLDRWHDVEFWQLRFATDATGPGHGHEPGNEAPGS